MSKECKADMMMILEEMKKVPSCNTLNREFCDSKWVVNKEGKKFCAGNEHGELVGLLAGGGSDNVTCSCAGSNILLENTDKVTLGLNLPGCHSTISTASTSTTISITTTTLPRFNSSVQNTFGILKISL